MVDLFVGIDVAIAKAKRLPVAVLARDGRKTSVVPLKDLGSKPHPLLPPRGRGNAAVVLDEPWRREFARDAIVYLRSLAHRLGGEVRSIAIDAPACPRRQEWSIRPSEAALRASGLSFFKTPSRADLQRVLAACAAHLEGGGEASRLPYANQLWMLVGFELFTTAARHFKDAEVLEVYPEAIFHGLGAADVHKSSPDGLESRVVALARALRVPVGELRATLPRVGWGGAHDRVDALAAAWVASLPRPARTSYGAAGDVIWSGLTRPNGA